MKTRLALVAVLSLATIGMNAQVPNDQPPPGAVAWTRVRLSISAGSPVKITTVPKRASITGTLRRVDDESITLTVNGLDRRLARADVLQVFAPSGTRRERHVKIGAAIGLGAALVVLAARPCPPRSSVCHEESAAYGLPLILGGGGLGWLMPRGIEWRQVYGRPGY